MGGTEALREKLGLRPVWDNGGVQRWTWVDSPKDVGSAPAEFHFAFDVREVPKKVKLLLEESARLKVKLNGRKVNARPGRGISTARCAPSSFPRSRRA